jgi:hypothetical protein
MAVGASPSRAAAFLTTFRTRDVMAGGGSAANGAYFNQVRAQSAGAAEVAYITWGQAAVSGAVVVRNVMPHANYTTTTIKCRVCHSIDEASINGTMLLPGANSCVACHVSTTTLTTVKIAAVSSLDPRHGGLTACNSYPCHTESPHGSNISIYEAGASVLLSDAGDFLTAAALRSGMNNAPVNATKTDVNLDGYFFDSLSVVVFQPDLDGADVTALHTPGDARGIAIQTGYTCTNDGCHVNGCFNGLSEDAYLGDYKLALNGESTALYGFDPATGQTKSQAYLNFQRAPDYQVADGIYGSQDLRTSPIKGHVLYAAFAGADETAPQLAWANSATCRNCHDQVDARFWGKSFPHHQTFWRACVDGDPNIAQIEGSNSDVVEVSDYGFVAQYNAAAWFNLADFAGGTLHETNTGVVPAYLSNPPEDGWVTLAMDGACLKCHKGSAASGVGITY